VEKLAAVMREEGWFGDWAPIVPIQPHGSRPPLFCLHPLSGQVLCFRSLARYLDPDQPVYGIQALWLDESVTSFIRLEDLAARYIRELRTVQPQGPYFLAGFSFGGVLAFEMAQQLQAQGEPIGLLAMIDRGAPGATKQPPRRTGLFDLWTGISQRFDALQKLEPNERFDYLVTGTQRRIQKRISKVRHRMASGLRRRCENDHPQGPRSMAAINRQALARYQPSVYPHRLTLFRACGEGAAGLTDPEVGWGPLAGGGVEVLEVPGLHLTMLDEPHVRFLGERLMARLQKAQRVAKPHIPIRAQELEACLEKAQADETREQA
jgi:thioesterase domain-containing protein